MSRAANDQVRSALLRHTKVPLGMPDGERRRLMDLMLKIHEQAMATFDALEANAVSEHDLDVMRQLPEYVNEFVLAIKAHAERRMADLR